MKKRVVSLIFMLLLLASTLLSCAEPSDDDLTPADRDTVTDGQGNVVEREDIAHLEHYFIGEVQYYRYHMGCAFRDDPTVHRLTDPTEAAELAAKPELSALLSHYSDAFYQKKDLLLLHTDSSSGSSRYELARLARDESGVLQLDLSLIVDGATDDMGCWLIVIPVDKDSAKKGETVSFCEFPYGVDGNTSLPDAQYIREGAGGGFDTPLQSVTFSTKEGLDEYRKAMGLDNAYAEYDEAFFAEKNRLALVSLPVNTAPASYALSGLSFAEDNTTLIIEITEVYAPKPKTNWRLLQLAVPLNSSIPAWERIEVNPIQADALPENATPLTPTVISEIEEQHVYHLTSPKDAAHFSDWFLSPHAKVSRAYYASPDDAFFRTHDLLVIPVTEGSGSIGHKAVDIIEKEDGSVTLRILRLYPGGDVTTDMAYHQIVIPVDKGLLGHSDSLYAQNVNVQFLPTHTAQLTVK